ncbi:MAG: hypothetical protein Q8N04_03775 [Nitrospira sp.]|nr:hypothetical protein [Nitrospira sp.]
MTQRTAPGILAALLAVITLSTGCNRWIDVLPSAASRADSATASIASIDRVPLILDQVTIRHNGAPQNPSTELDRRLLGSLQSLNLFSQLSLAEQGTSTVADKTVVARMRIDDAVDSHPGEAAWKGIVIGTSMFLLAPVMELHYDYGTTLTLELERWDGTVKTYHAESSGIARYNLFSASPSMIAELKGHVMEAGITDLMNQLVKDATFYNASSAPVTERTIHSVSIRSRRPTPAAITISTTAPNEPR